MPTIEELSTQNTAQGSVPDSVNSRLIIESDTRKYNKNTDWLQIENPARKPLSKDFSVLSKNDFERTMSNKGISYINFSSYSGLDIKKTQADGTVKTYYKGNVLALSLAEFAKLKAKLKDNTISNFYGYYVEIQDGFDGGAGGDIISTNSGYIRQNGFDGKGSNHGYGGAGFISQTYHNGSFRDVFHGGNGGGGSAGTISIGIVASSSITTSSSFTHYVDSTPPSDGNILSGSYSNGGSIDRININGLININNSENFGKGGYGGEGAYWATYESFSKKRDPNFFSGSAYQKQAGGAYVVVLSS